MGVVTLLSVSAVILLMAILSPLSTLASDDQAGPILSPAQGQLQPEFQTIPISGLVAYYPFNGNANDESGNGNDGTVVGATLTTDRFGNPNSAYSFDGSDDYIRVPDDDSLDLSDGMTIMAWINSNDTSGPKVIVSKWNDNTSDHSYIFKDHDSSDKLLIELSKGYHNDLAKLEGTTSIATEEWIHVATTFDSNTVELYFNGIEDASSAAIGVIRNSATDLLIGAVFTWGGIFQNFDGVIDDVRVYNRALTEAEIQALYLSIGKTVTPTTNVTYHSTVTYTVVLDNSGPLDANGVLLTDTLPSEVDFACWVVQPAGASVDTNDQITWSGTVTASNAITLTFVVTHTGDYGDVVTNTVEYSHTIGGGSDEATFTVESTIPVYLPIILKGA